MSAGILAAPFTTTEHLQASAAEGLQAIVPLWQDRQRPAAIAVAAAVITQTAERDLKAAGTILSTLCTQLTALLQPGFLKAPSTSGDAAGIAGKGQASLDGQVAGDSMEAGMQLLLQLGESTCTVLGQLLPSLLAKVPLFFLC